MNGSLEMWQPFSVAVLCLAGVLLSAQPVSGQISGEGYATMVHGAGERGARLTGVVGGGGVLFRDRFGVDAEIGLVGDNSDERVLAPLIAVGGSLRVAPRRRIGYRPARRQLHE